MTPTIAEAEVGGAGGVHEQIKVCFIPVAAQVCL